MGFIEKVDSTEKNVPTVTKRRRMSKNGAVYECLVIHYKGFNKVVFMNDAEQFVFNDLPLIDELPNGK